MTKVLSFRRAVSYVWTMTTARLRLFLALVALVLVPLAAPAVAAPPMMAVQQAQSCDHGCGDSPAMDHSAAACALGCLQAALPPLMLPAAVEAVPAMAVQRQPPPQSPLLLATRWPPPKRPPRL